MFRLTRALHAMGTRCRIDCYAIDEHAGKAGVEGIMAELKRLEARYSRYRQSGFLSEITRSAPAGELMKSSTETAYLLNYAATSFAQSDGLFDISGGVLR